MLTSKASFLYLLIIKQKNETKLFDKRDAFPVSIVGMPHLDNMISLNIYNASTISKVLTASDSNTFIRLLNFFFFFFSIWVFFHEHSRFTGQQGKGEGIYLTPLCT